MLAYCLSCVRQRLLREAVVGVTLPALLQRRGAAGVSATKGVGVGSLGEEFCFPSE